MHCVSSDGHKPIYFSSGDVCLALVPGTRDRDSVLPPAHTMSAAQEGSPAASLTNPAAHVQGMDSGPAGAVGQGALAQWGLLVY